jgi:hypothetical protein
MSLTLAQQAFGTQETGPMTLVPRMKFNYTLEFELNVPTNNLGVQSRIITIDRVRSAQLPSFQSNVQIFNQYNQKRAVPTKLDFDPLAYQFYDTHDNEMMNILRVYMSTYFNDDGLELANNAQIANSVTSDTFRTNMGRKLVPDEFRNFFKSLTIIQHGITDPVTLFQNVRRTTIVNPALMSMQLDTLDYSDSSPVIISMQLAPEQVQIVDTDVNRA